jgi:hypothetical protein
MIYWEESLRIFVSASKETSWSQRLFFVPTDFCIEGQAAVPYEQKTQQSPCLGLSKAPQPLQS